MPVSRRERWYCSPKTSDLVREAVGCTGVLGGNLVLFHTPARRAE
jgi:hypothetical protein